MSDATPEPIRTPEQVAEDAQKTLDGQGSNGGE